MSDAWYWADRVRRYGHTGWSNPAVYVYDQRLRLAAVRRAMQAIPGGSGTAALDFGCGAGDFCALLASHFGQVLGYDISPEVLALAALRRAAPNVQYVSLLDAALGSGIGYDLILSITVLQHVTDDTELQKLLRGLAAALRVHGRFVVLETFNGGQGGADGHLKRRNIDDLIAAFAAVDLRLVSRRGFYHPTERPTAAFVAYRTRPLVRWLGRLATWRLPGARWLLAGIAARAASADRDYLDQPASPTQLLVFEHRPP